mgnify:CR=1 FL=1
MIAIIDYGVGNLRSVHNAVKFISPHTKSFITSDPEQILKADRIIFPGQGAMPDCVRELEKRGLSDALKEAAKEGLIEYTPGEDNFIVKEESRLNDKQKAALNFIKTNVLDRWQSTGVQDVLDTAVLKLLKLIAIFPGGVNKLGDQYGNILPDCFLLPEGSTALDFAYRLHTDFGKNFIRSRISLIKPRLSI